MFRAALISLSRGQSYTDIDVLEHKMGDFDKYNVPSPFGSRTIAFYHHGELILCHPWGVRLIHLDHKSRGWGKPKNFEFNRIILDGDISYVDGVYIDDDYFQQLSIPDIFEDPGEVIDQVSFSCDQGVFITHDANVVSIISKSVRRQRGVTRHCAVTNETIVAQSANRNKKIVKPLPR